MTLSKIGSTEYFGPIAIKAERDRVEYCHRLNETSSQRDYVCPLNVVHFTELSKHESNWVHKEGDQWVCVPNIKNYVHAGLAALYQPMLEEHTDRRVMVFFLQMAAAFGSGLLFTNEEARHQAESGTSLIMKATGETYEVLISSEARHAAHSSVLPCLVASHPENRVPCIFAKDSDLYRHANATMVLPKFINLQCDIALEYYLRPAALAILHRVSQGEVTPADGLYEFMQRCEQFLKELIQRKSGGVRIVFDIYHKRICDLFQSFDEDRAQFLNELLSLQVDAKIAAEELHEIHMRCYCQIRSDMLSQSYFMQQVNDLVQQVIRAIDTTPEYDRKKKKSVLRKWWYKKEALYTVLLERATDKAALSTCLGFPQQAFIARALELNGKGERTKFLKTVERVRRCAFCLNAGI